MRTMAGLAAISLLLFIGAPEVMPEVPMVITYQGILTENDTGEPYNGNANVIFGIYAYLGGPDMTLLWSESNDVSFSEGYFSVLLGDNTPLPDSLFGRQLYLGISIGGTELFPRRELTSGAFSIQSKFVEHLVPENVNQFFSLAYSMPDADGDGYIKRSMGGDDCNDMDPTIHPWPLDPCDGIDNNCDGQIDENGAIACELPAHAADVGCQNGQCVILECELGWIDDNGVYADGCESQCSWVYIDNDCDNWVPFPGVGLDSVCLQNYGGCYTAWPNPHFGDCDDWDPTMHPGATELCDNLDNDCDMMVDENVPPEPCPMEVGVCAGATSQCVNGYIMCDYGPYYEEFEVSCDGRDNDCDGEIDENCP